jgi:hypothetical protein
MRHLNQIVLAHEDMAVLVRLFPSRSQRLAERHLHVIASLLAETTTLGRTPAC